MKNVQVVRFLKYEKNIIFLCFGFQACISYNGKDAGIGE